MQIAFNKLIPNRCKEYATPLFCIRKTSEVNLSINFTNKSIPNNPTNNVLFDSKRNSEISFRQKKRTDMHIPPHNTEGINEFHNNLGRNISSYS